MELFPIDREGRLFISPDIDNWQPILDLDIRVIIDLDDDLDIGVPEVPNQMLYVYYPIEDMPERQGALYNKAFADYVCCAEISPMQPEFGAGI